MVTGEMLEIKEIQMQSSEIVSGVLLVAVHTVLIGSVASGLVFISFLVFWKTEDNPMEKVLRVVAALLALLAYFLSKVARLDVPSVLFEALVGVSLPAQFSISLLVGGALGWFVTHFLHWLFLRGHEGKQVRYVILIFTLLLALFTDTYIATYAVVPEEGLNPALLPNGTFILGAGLYLLTITTKGGGGTSWS